MSQNSVFVSGLPYDTTEEEIKDFFKECGKIIEIKLPRYQDTGRLIGYSHIKFEKAEEAAKALLKNKSYMKKRYLDVQLSKGENAKTFVHTEPPPDGCKTAFIKGFPYEATEDEIGDFFRSCGDIENVRIVYNSVKKHSKGYGYVDFRNPEALNKALELNNKIFQGRKIFVDFETGKARQGFKLKMEKEGNEKYSRSQDMIVKKKIKKEKKEETKYVKIKNNTTQKAQPKEKKLSLFD